MLIPTAQDGRRLYDLVPMRKLLKVVVWILGVVLVLALGAAGVARVIAGRKYNTALDDARRVVPDSRFR